MFKRIAGFFAEVKGEFKKVSWPSREQTVRQTGVVLMITLIASVFLGIIDYGLSEAVKQVIR
ncbi:MAG: preprotein translocase subunit SecE [Candidatus Lambdaproteobacteria bacterium RIFOXYD1_FULL_56_27]|uniref:Protein translocase subunit SecE n=1 Tax=Candidatus Lambdaproteobacteria bacterium RIFOXYD2_FULL_56_26 TaxID=1817773 RepID=A0A1F6GVL9_9PROT|nr:MAG: preprotein translocase subunit SecE [Candidatus Lambdaproteobacteria bacterium RIFOXYD2_FULL_56_26]OGH03292.1 MAG: preprotein translocase subunit SecE [Candidatus Lambdaproteobacteria bacterium RIFOXYC1_FULL_56_13]OGH07490.1 MAG: preprotein translocase subunit SecE [Candidatus Lambdaproteobacteria bacterium RIFOXYD1_FULL_56_27]